MEELINRLTSYNLLNNLLPGVVFCVLATFFTDFSFIQDDLITGIFVYYMVGVVIGRFGSLILEPFLKQVGVIKNSDYEDYIRAEKSDTKLEVLSETNNMYRALTAMCLLLFLVRFYETVEETFSLQSYRPDIVIGILLFLFLASYHKQAKYITERVRLGKEK